MLIALVVSWCLTHGMKNATFNNSRMVMFEVGKGRLPLKRDLMV